MTAKQPESASPVLRKAALLLLGAALMIQLGAMAWMGSYMRMSGDDYCYGEMYRQYGLLGGVFESYLNHGHFNGNRYSLTLFSNIAEFFGPTANAVIPGLAVVLFGEGAFLVLRRVFQRQRRAAPRAPDLPLEILALTFVFFTLLLTPEIRQSLYWRSAMLPYLAPVISGIFLAAGLLFYLGKESISIFVAAGLLLAGFLAGGFSETGAVFLAASIVQGAIIVYLARRQVGADRAFYIACGANLAGVIVAMVLLAFSPANSTRLGDAASGISIFETALIGFRSAAAFVYTSLRSQPLPASVFFLINFLISFLIWPEMGTPVWSRQRSIVAAAGLASTGAVLWAVMLPFALIQQAYPEPRALVIARFELHLAIAAVAWILGSLAGSLLANWNTNPRVFKALSLAGLILAAAYTLRLLPVTLQYQRTFEKWSRLWDQRHAEITASALAAAPGIDVMKLDHIIPEVAELNTDSGNWYTTCAEGYYGIKEIRASLPGWDTAE